MGKPSENIYLFLGSVIDFKYICNVNLISLALHLFTLVDGFNYLTPNRIILIAKYFLWFSHMCWVIFNIVNKKFYHLWCQWYHVILLMNSRRYSIVHSKRLDCCSFITFLKRILEMNLVYCNLLEHSYEHMSFKETIFIANNCSKILNMCKMFNNFLVR